MKTTRIVIWALIGLLVGLLAGVFVSAWKGAGVGITRSDKISQTMSIINRMYVDPVDVDSLAESIIPQILSELDPHSTYIPARDLQRVNEPLEGEFDGIGVMFNMLTDTVVVLNVIPSGPSDKAGVQNGDRIIRIDDSLVAGRKLAQNEVVKRLRGPRGTTVKLGIERQGARELVPITVTRGVIPLKSLDAAFMIEPEVAFVKLSAFSNTSADELNEALARLKKGGMKRLIFDLRGNSGGYLHQAIYIANMFLPSNLLIVYTVDRAGKQTKEFSNGRGGFTDVPMVVLIDEQSASSSEILAGAIQDNDRGLIVGRRSFGKGLVQSEIPYPDGSAMRLTVARYYTPSGRSIQKPYNDGIEIYESDFLRRYAPGGEAFNESAIPLTDTTTYRTLKGRIVYGGGGIRPDQFVAVDTMGLTPYYKAVNGKNLTTRFSLEWGDRHRAEMNSVSSLEELSAMLDRYPRLVDEFVVYAARNGVAADSQAIAESRPVFEAQLRAMIGRNTALDYNGFYANIYVIDSTVLKAIEVVKGMQ